MAYCTQLKVELNEGRKSILNAAIIEDCCKCSVM